MLPDEPSFARCGLKLINTNDTMNTTEAVRRINIAASSSDQFAIELTTPGPFKNPGGVLVESTCAFSVSGHTNRSILKSQESEIAKETNKRLFRTSDDFLWMDSNNLDVTETSSGISNTAAWVIL